MLWSHHASGVSTSVAAAVAQARNHGAVEQGPASLSPDWAGEEVNIKNTDLSHSFEVVSLRGLNSLCAF